jgi:hypothetical protein
MTALIRKKELVLFAVFSVACACATAQTTDDFEAALFGSADAAGSADSQDSAFDAKSAEGEKAKTEYLVGGTVAVGATVTASPSERQSTETADANGKLFARVTIPDQGTLFASYAARHYFVQGHSGDGAALPADDPSEIDWNLSELYYSFDVAKKVFIRLGNQLVAWGPSQIWSPVDFINLQRNDAFAKVDTRAGKSGLKIHVPVPGGNAFFFSDFSQMTNDGTYGDPAKTVNLAGRFDFTAADFEFGFSGYGGQNAQMRGGCDFSGRFAGTTLYGEMALLPEYDRWTQAMQASLGFSRSLGDLKRWTVSAEGFFNSKGHDYSGYSSTEMMTVPAENKIPLYGGRWYAYAAIAADKLFSDYLATTLSSLGNVEERTYRLKASESVSLPKVVPFTVDVAYAGGGSNREFTRDTGNNAISVTLSTTLSF